MVVLESSKIIELISLKFEFPSVSLLSAVISNSFPEISDLGCFA